MDFGCTLGCSLLGGKRIFRTLGGLQFESHIAWWPCLSPRFLVSLSRRGGEGGRSTRKLPKLCGVFMLQLVMWCVQNVFDWSAQAGHWTIRLVGQCRLKFQTKFIVWTRSLTLSETLRKLKKRSDKTDTLDRQNRLEQATGRMLQWTRLVYKMFCQSLKIFQSAKFCTHSFRSQVFQMFVSHLNVFSVKHRWRPGRDPHLSLPCRYPPGGGNVWVAPRPKYILDNDHPPPPPPMTIWQSGMIAAAYLLCACVVSSD